MATTCTEADYLVEVKDGPNFEDLKISIGSFPVKFTLEYTHRAPSERKINQGKPLSFSVEMIALIDLENLVRLRAESGSVVLNLAMYNTKTRTGIGLMR